MRHNSLIFFSFILLKGGESTIDPLLEDLLRNEYYRDHNILNNLLKKYGYKILDRSRNPKPWRLAKRKDHSRPEEEVAEELLQRFIAGEIEGELGYLIEQYKLLRS